MDNQIPTQPISENPSQTQVPIKPPESSPPLHHNSLNWLKLLIGGTVALLILAIFGGGGYLLGTKKNAAPPVAEQQTSTLPTTTPTPDPTANWITYTNTNYNYSIKYPQEMEIYSTVEGLPDNEDQRQLSTTCCIGIFNKAGSFYDILGIEAFEEKRTLEQYKDDLLANGNTVRNLRDIKILDKEALEYNFTSNYVVTLINNNIRFDFLYTKDEYDEYDDYLVDQILSTFKFTQ